MPSTTTNRRAVRTFLSLALAATAIAARPSAAAGGEELRQAMGGVAAQVARFLQARDESSVSVGQFTGPPNFPTSSGPGLSRLLTEELTKAGLDVRSRAAVGIKGEYVPNEGQEYDPASGRNVKVLAVRIKVSVVDAFGEVLTELDLNHRGRPGDPVVTDEEAVVSLLGVPVSLEGDDLVKRDERLREAYFETPPAHVAGGTRVSVSPEDPYAVEVLVGGAPRPVSIEDGLAHVRLGRGESYEVRLTNASPHDAAVELLIDGLSVFAFSEVVHADGPRRGRPKYGFFVIPARQSVVVRGWHRTNERVDSFLITEYARGAAASLGSEAGVGTITANFHAAWPVGGTPPADEPRSTKGRGDATGFGPPKDVRSVEVPRQVGRLRTSVSVRYAKS